jgi:hypothetical protein
MLSNPDMPMTVDHMSPTAAVLDNVVFTSLTGPHGRLAQRHGRAVRYPAEVSGFAALPDQPRQQDWSDLAQLANTARGVAVAGLGGEVPEGWNTLSRLIVIQMVDEGVDARPDAEVIRLTSGDVPEMLDLVEQTQPGPFAPRTIEMGTYLGFRSAGQLIAMAGERFHPTGGPRSARCARRQRPAAAGWRRASSMRLRTRSGSGVRRRSCMSPNRIPRRLRSTRRWASSGAGGPKWWSSGPRTTHLPICASRFSVMKWRQGGVVSQSSPESHSVRCVFGRLLRYVGGHLLLFLQRAIEHVGVQHAPRFSTTPIVLTTLNNTQRCVPSRLSSLNWRVGCRSYAFIATVSLPPTTWVTCRSGRGSCTEPGGSKA